MRRVLGLLLGAVALLVACGVPEDSAPQELTAADVPFGMLTTAPTTTTTPIDLAPDREAALYFMDVEGNLRPLNREVEDRSAATVIMTLLATDSSSLPPRYSTNIPPDTTLLDSFVDDQVLTLDLSEQFTTVVGQRFIAAVAQIVYTATDLDGIEAVSFRVEGEDFPVNDENGAAQDEPVDRLDFVGLAPS